MSALRGPGDSILDQVDWWAWMYSCPCPQSHLARCLGLDPERLAVRLMRLVDAGTLVFVPQRIGGHPDVRRVTPRRHRGWHWRYKVAQP